MYDYVGGKFFILYKLKTTTLILLMCSIYSMYMKLRLYVLEIVTVLKEQMVQSFLWLLKEHPYFVQCILFAVDSDYYRLSGHYYRMSGQICNLVTTYWLSDL